jgi:hypothetical protein
MLQVFFGGKLNVVTGGIVYQCRSGNMFTRGNIRFFDSEAHDEVFRQLVKGVFEGAKRSAKDAKNQGTYILLFFTLHIIYVGD